MLIRRMILSALLCLGLGCTAQLERQQLDGDPEAPAAPEAPTPSEPIKPLDPVAPLRCDVQAQRFGAPRVWRLTRAQLDQAASALAGAPVSFADSLSPESATESGLLNSASALRSMVEMCSTQLNLQLFPEEVEAIAAVLNWDHYKFK